MKKVKRITLDADLEDVTAIRWEDGLPVGFEVNLEDAVIDEVWVEAGQVVKVVEPDA